MSVQAPPAVASPAALEFQNVALCPATEADAPFERQLFETARPDAALLATWPDAMRGAFLDQQFHFQTVHYRRAYPGVDWLLVLKENERIGRLILDRAPDQWCLVDIALLPAWRGQGIGAALLRTVLADAARLRAPCVRLSVDVDSRAQRLYARLGFAVEDDGVPHVGMVWRPMAGR